MSEAGQPLQEGPRPPAPWFAWLETVVLAAAAPLMGLIVQTDDPFFLQTGFPWPGLAPVLAGLRYGFPQGLGCAIMTLVGLLGAWRAGLGLTPGVAAQFSFGVLALGMISGEFRDQWSKRVKKAVSDAAFRKARLDEFTRVYHLLRVSHHKLEQRLAGGTPNLREMLLTLRDSLMLARPSSEPMLGLSTLILDIFMSHGGTLAAVMFEVNKEGHCADAPVGRLGKVPPPPASDPLLLQAISSRKVSSVHDLVTAKAESATLLLAVVPLVDVHERVWGLVAVQDMQFVAFQEDNLRMLAILGGHVADLLATSLRGAADPAGERFNMHLLRALHSLQNYAEPAAAVRIRFGLGKGTGLVEPLRKQRRGLDSQWIDTDAEGAPLMLVLMPMTDRAAVEGFLARIEDLSRTHLGTGLKEAGIVVYVKVLEPNDTEETVLAALGDKTAVQAGLQHRPAYPLPPPSLVVAASLAAAPPSAPAGGAPPAAPPEPPPGPSEGALTGAEVERTDGEAGRSPARSRSEP